MQNLPEEAYMSLLALAWQLYPAYPLMILYNRDENRERPAEKLQRWDTSPVIYGGRDPVSGGSWLAITETGKFAALTDFHHANMQALKAQQSRGQLLIDYLQSELDPESFLRRTAARRQQMLPCNLVLGDRQNVYYSCSVSQVEEELSPGVHSLSDYFMDTPMPKCRYLQKALQKRMQDELLSAEEREELFELLARPMRFPEEELPRRGFDLHTEAELSPIFLELGDYGTVSSALITVDAQGEVLFSERSYQPGQEHSTHSLSFQLAAPR